MHKQIFAVAVLVAAIAYFIDSLGAANASFSGPTITGGESPWISFAGDPTLLMGESETIYTVPSDRSLVITGARLSTSLVDLYEGETLRIDGGSDAMSYGFLAHGNGHISFPAGAEVRLVNPDGSSARPYYIIFGYLAHP